MISFGLIAALLGTAPTGFTAAAERVPLTRTNTKPPSLTVEPLPGRLVLSNVRPRSLRSSTLCPQIDTQGDRTVMRCTTRRLWAEVIVEEGGTYLDIRLLIGLPWEGELALPMRAWPIRAYGIPDECPGRLEVTRGQCELELGTKEEAEQLFKKARSGSDANFAYLRLAELALQRGAAEEAVQLLAFVPPMGPIGRLARARLCDLTGSCLSETISAQAGDTQGLEEPLKSELGFITWRREIFMGREAKAMAPFVDALQKSPELCRGVVPLCQRMLIAGLSCADDHARGAALAGWLVQSVRRGPHELELARAAARAAQDLGAPSFGAAVLASSSALVPPVELNAHLLKTVELYLESRDLIRAEAIFDYAEGRLGAGSTSTGPWRAVRRTLKRHRVEPRAALTPTLSSVPVKTLESNVGLARELARAAAARGRAQGVNP